MYIIEKESRANMASTHKKKKKKKKLGFLQIFFLKKKSQKKRSHTESTHARATKKNWSITASTHIKKVRDFFRTWTV